MADALWLTSIRFAVLRGTLERLRAEAPDALHVDCAGPSALNQGHAAKRRGRRRIAFGGPYRAAVALPSGTADLYGRLALPTPYPAKQVAFGIQVAFLGMREGWGKDFVRASYRLLRAITKSDLRWESSVMMSSVMPSAK